MNSKKYLTFTSEEFVLDDDFMRWVQQSNEESDHFWKTFLLQNPEKSEELEEAVLIIRSLKVVEPPVPSRGFIEKDPTKQIKKASSGMISRKLLKIAAIFLFMITLGGLFYYSQHQLKNLPVELADNRFNEKGRIILPDGTVSEFESKETAIQQTANGNLTINNDTLLLKEGETKTEASSMTKVSIPYGKRSEITLAEGTRIWLNAGSSLSYPLHFSRNRREVYLSGEAFFEVTSDDAKPFYVITNDMKIRVTGTRFNVTSYHNDAFTQAVLVEGKIEASKNRLLGRAVALSPGERVVYDREEKILQKDKVDVALYSSWVNGYLIIDNEPVEEIFKKLERYYNQKIVVDVLNDHPRFTGKLNLADDLEKVLNNIAFSGSFSVVRKDSLFKIQQ